jgi:H+/Cl- antiporter ClcA
VLLAMELLLFEYRVRSLVPVCLASVSATLVRVALVGTAPAFQVIASGEAPARALIVYFALGACLGLAAVAITKWVYALEDAFTRLPIHWMWWPAMGAVVVGVIGWIEPRSMGVGYDNIENIVSGRVVGGALLALGAFKFGSWLIALSSGTSGGTLAPLFTIGSALGGLLTSAIAQLAPGLGLDARMGALVGMAALFAGASRAILASVVFAFETTHATTAVLPLLTGCSAAYLVSCALMKHSIMTEKIARRAHASQPRALSTWGY